MRTPWLIGIVVGAHLLAAALVILLPGCGTPGAATPRGEPVVEMPPTQNVGESVPEIKTTKLPEVTAWPPASEETSTYVVKKGDSLSIIANRFGLTTRELARINGIADPNKIVVGQKLLVPGSTGAAETVATPAAAKKPVEAPPAGNVYVVKKGDSLSVIAARYGIATKALKAANNLTGDKIVVDQKLKIPGKPAGAANAPVIQPDAGVIVKDVAPPRNTKVLTLDAAPAAISTPHVQPAAEAVRTYVVKEDDADLVDIAMMWNVSEEKIKQLNGLTSSEVTPGQRLKIPLAE